MRDSSIEAFESIVDEKQKRQRQVLKVIRDSKAPVCDRDIAEVLGWTINRVTGRRNELENKGVIVSVGRLPNRHSKIKVHHFKIVKQ